MATVGTDFAEVQRISNVLFDPHRKSLDEFVNLESNRAARVACTQFAERTLDHLALIGPAGCGKTHLLSAVANQFSESVGVATTVLSANQYLSGSFADTPPILLLDDVQDVLGKRRQTQHLQWLLERRIRANRPTLLAFNGALISRSIKNTVPLARSWRFVAIGQPTIDDRRLLCRQFTKTAGVRVSNDLVEILARHMEGTGRAFEGAFKRLKLTSTNWTDDRKTLAACAALTPFFEDSGNWDLAHFILRVAQAKKAKYPGIKTSEMALYTMMSVAHLGEEVAAKCLEISPGAAYSRSRMIAEFVDSNDQARHYVDEFVRTVVRQLASHN